MIQGCNIDVTKILKTMNMKGKYTNVFLKFPLKNNGILEEGAKIFIPTPI
jgi:hypothetical protein